MLCCIIGHIDIDHRKVRQPKVAFLTLLPHSPHMWPGHTHSHLLCRVPALLHLVQSPAALCGHLYCVLPSFIAKLFSFTYFSVSVLRQMNSRVEYNKLNRIQRVKVCCRTSHAIVCEIYCLVLFSLVFPGLPLSTVSNCPIKEKLLENNSQTLFKDWPETERKKAGTTWE